MVVRNIAFNIGYIIGNMMGYVLIGAALILVVWLLKQLFALVRRTMRNSKE